jgi:hypothetical protein
MHGKHHTQWKYIPDEDKAVFLKHMDETGLMWLDEETFKNTKSPSLPSMLISLTTPTAPKPRKWQPPPWPRRVRNHIMAIFFILHCTINNGHSDFFLTYNEQTSWSFSCLYRGISYTSSDCCCNCLRLLTLKQQTASNHGRLFTIA